MGNADLRDIAVIETTTMDAIEGATVAVDAYNWLYKYLTTTTQWTDDDVYTTSDGTELPTLLGAVRGLPRFFEHDLSPVFVFDGSAHDLKAEELADRRETRAAAADAAADARAAGDELRAAQLEARAQTLTDPMLESTKDLLDCLDIPYLTAPQAAEAYAAQLGREGVVDYVISEDYDALLYGAPTTVRKFTSSGDDIELLSLEATLADHDLSWPQLVGVGLLCGTDYNEGIRGVGPATAVSGMRDHGDLASFLTARDASFEHDPEVLQSIFLDVATPDPDCDLTPPSPDLDAAHELVVSEYDLPESAVETAFERFETATVQTGLDQW